MTDQEPVYGGPGPWHGRKISELPPDVLVDWIGGAKGSRAEDDQPPRELAAKYGSRRI